MPEMGWIQQGAVAQDHSQSQISKIKINEGNSGVKPGIKLTIEVLGNGPFHSLK